MNVLLIIEGTYPWYRGGVSEWIYQYIINRPNFNFSILQIATDSFLDLKTEDALYPLPDNIVEFSRVPPPEFVNKWDESLNIWYKSLGDSITKITLQHDVIHVTNTGFAGWLGIKVSDSLTLPLVLTEHAVYWLEVLKGAVALECGYQIPDATEPKEQVVSLFKKIASDVYKKANQIITVSECNIPLQEQLGASEVEYIPNGIPSNWIDLSSKTRSIPVIGWVGRCAEMKNPLQFFDFIDQFEDLSFDAKYLMLLSDAGEYELESKVREKAESIDSLTVIWNQSAKEYYQQMDMLLITSHNESQPLVMFEALSKHVLPIGREVGDLTNKYGLTFNKKSSNKEISIQIIDFWNSTELFIHYLEERFERIRKDHTWNSIFSNYEQVIKQTVQNYGTNGE